MRRRARARAGRPMAAPEDRPQGHRRFEVVVHGRAAHAGLEPEKGVNALDRGRPPGAGDRRARPPEAGTTVTPTVARPARPTTSCRPRPRVRVDVRVTELGRGDPGRGGDGGPAPGRPEARLEVLGGLNRPPMPGVGDGRAVRAGPKVAADAGLPSPVGVAVGGGSDGNFTAALGVPTLDGLGVTGGGAHADHEYAEVATMLDRSASSPAWLTAIQSR